MYIIHFQYIEINEGGGKGERRGDTQMLPDSRGSTFSQTLGGGEGYLAAAKSKIIHHHLPLHDFWVEP